MSESPIDDKPSEGKPSDQPADEPMSERPGEWRSDWSGSRFTEPPSRPSSAAADKLAGERQGKTSGERQGKTSGERQGKTVGDRPGKPSGDRPGRVSGDRPGKTPGDRPGKSAGDSVADLQRWLMKAGARSMANQVADNVRRTLGQPKRDSGDVWDTATTEPPQDEPPECQWCPVCQAARRMRVSGPGIGDRLASVGGVFASVVQDAFSAVDKAMKVQPPAEGQQDKAS